MMKECQRVLKTGGYYMAISFSEPKNREYHLTRAHLDFTLKTMKIAKKHEKSGEMVDHYIYICKKGPNAKEKQ